MPRTFTSPMKNSKVNKKLEALIAVELPKLANIMYIPHNEGYLLFEQFYLRRNASEWLVDFRHTTQTFYSAAIAIAWCIAKNARDETAARLIEKQAALYTRYVSEIQYYKKLISSISDPYSEKVGLFEAKLSNSLYYATRARSELNKCLKIAKYRQTIGFNNEIRRPVTTKLSRRYK